MKLFARAAVLLLGCVVVVGCGGEGQSSRTPVLLVSGKITMGGQPVADAVVNFVGKGNQPTATGKTDGEGVYKLTTYENEDGAAEGEYTVLVTKVAANAAAAKELQPGDPGYGDPSPYPGDNTEVKYEVPEKYTRSKDSPLKVTVSADAAAGAYDFDLKAE